MKKHMLRSGLLVLLCAASVSLVAGQQASAATAAAAKTAPPTNTNTLKVSPVRSDISINPGSSAKVQTFLTNLTSSPITIHPIENDFVAGDESGTPSIILDENSYAPTHSLKRFMVPLQNITLLPNSTQEVDVTINVPSTVKAGGYYLGAVRFTPASNTGSNSVNLSASVASLILMTVPGPTVEKLSLTNFDVQKDGTSATNFRKPDGLNLLVRFQNKGSIQEMPFGQIYVQKGKKVVYSYNFNQTDPKDTILPDSYRRWTVPLKNIGKFGKYKIGATFTYGSKGESLQVSKTIWIIPTTYIIGAVLAVLLIVVVIVGIWAGLRSYKRRILRNSRRRY